MEEWSEQDEQATHQNLWKEKTTYTFLRFMLPLRTLRCIIEGMYVQHLVDRMSGISEG